MSAIIRCLMALVLSALPLPALAEGFTALARVVPGSAVAEDAGAGIAFRLEMSQPVPWRVFTLDDPARLVVDFSELDWSGVTDAELDRSERVTGVAMGRFRPGWSRIVLELDGPYAVSEAGLDTGAGSGLPAALAIRLGPTDPAGFAATAGAPSSALFTLPERVADLAPPRRRQSGDRPVVVALDPGHGGLDPGAERGGHAEADLVLTFARELRELLLRDGFEVVMTRDADIFVPLEARQSIARAGGADLFLSLHADALAEGRARGATVYTLAESASDLATAKLAERHDRSDLLAGVDLAGQGDRIAAVLMDLARTETQPRSERLADRIAEGLDRATGNLHKRPRLSGAFSVLKAPDIPAVLIELGFMSDPRDLANLIDPAWRARAAEGIRDGLVNWASEDAAEALLVRQ